MDAGRETSLTSAAEERFGPAHQLAATVHSLERPVNAVAQFAAVVQEHAEAGDDIATAIVRDAAHELVATSLAAAGICAAGTVPLVVLGRAAAPGTPLRSEVERLVHDEARLVLVDAAGGPLDGALQLASADAPHVYDQFISKWSTP